MNIYWVVRSLYTRNRVWGDGRCEALWFALRGKAFPHNWDEQADNEWEYFDTGEWMDKNE